MESSCDPEEPVMTGDLFDPRRLARNEDPVESKRAAESVVPSLSALRRQAYELVRDNPGLIARELSAIAGHSDPRTLNRRLGEVEEMRLIRRGESRPCAVTGRHCATWFPAPDPEKEER